MEYPLEEKIGPPELLVGRAAEFAEFNLWLKRIEGRLSQSRVILARRKSGKTSFVQRIFNELWNENGGVIPFYFDIEDKNIWLPEFAIKYYRAFASQYISFLERDPSLLGEPLRLEEIRAYGVEKENRSLVRDVDSLYQDRKDGHYSLMWETASAAPHRYAAVYKKRFLIILDEFQNIATHVYPDSAFKAEPIESMPGSFHSLSESKIAPMLVTGSYIGILLDIMEKYLEAGRLSITRMKPSLDPKEGVLAVYKYAEVYDVPITNKTANQINELCMSDPFFISCVIHSNFEGKDLTNEGSVIDTVNYEITHRESQMSKTWAEYLHLTFKRINGQNTKNLMLFLNKNHERNWTPKDLKKKLNLDLEVEDIYERLILLSEADVLLRHSSDYQFSGLKDGTLNLILRERFEEEIEGFEPNLKTEFQARLAALEADKKSLQGRNSYLEGMMAEHLLAVELRVKQHIRLANYFTGLDHIEVLTLVDVQERVPYRRTDGKSEEIDIIAKADDGRILMIEVRKRQEKTGIKAMKGLWNNAKDYAQQYDVVVLPAYLSWGGFTEETKTYCIEQGIGMAEEINYDAK